MERKINEIDCSIFDSDATSYRYTILIVLNRPINPDLFKLVKSRCNFIICADGAANRLFDTSEIK